MGHVEPSWIAVLYLGTSSRNPLISHARGCCHFGADVLDGDLERPTLQMHVQSGKKVIVIDLDYAWTHVVLKELPFKSHFNITTRHFDMFWLEIIMLSNHHSVAIPFLCYQRSPHHSGFLVRVPNPGMLNSKHIWRKGTRRFLRAETRKVGVQWQFIPSFSSSLLYDCCNAGRTLYSQTIMGLVLFQVLWEIWTGRNKQLF